MVATADSLRVEGNELLKANNIIGAIGKYTEAVEMNPNDHVVLSNRSAAKLLQKDLISALVDAEQCIQLAPKWVKSYMRKVNVLKAMGRIDEARAVCVSALCIVAESEADTLKVLLGEFDIEAIRESLRGSWRGRVTAELGGYSQVMTFGQANNIKVEVFGQIQNCTYSLDLSCFPNRLTISFGPDGSVAQVPYIFELRDDGHTLAMCCPYLVPELPSEFDGPGFVLMKKADAADEGDEELLARKRAADSLSNPEEKLLRYLEDFAAILAQVPVPGSPAESLGLDSEVQANKRVVDLMATHVKVSELEQVYTAAIAKKSFGVIAGGDDFTHAPEETKAVALRLRDLLLSTGFISTEGLETARLQYTKTVKEHTEPVPESKARLQRKLLERKSGSTQDSAQRPSALVQNETQISQDDFSVYQNPEPVPELIKDTNTTGMSVLYVVIGLLAVAAGAAVLSRRLNSSR